MEKRAYHRLRRKAAAWAAACLLLAGSVLSAAATDTSQNYTFQVTANGGESCAAEPGETVQVELSLSRTDDSGPMTIYAMSSVLRFHSGLLELQDLQTGEGISSTVTERSGSLEGWSDVTLNYLAPSMDGTAWENGATLVTLTLKAVRYGSSLIQVRRGSVSTYSGMDSYSTELGSAVVSIQKAPEEPIVPIEPTDPEQPDEPVPPAEPGGTTPPEPSTPGGTAAPTTPSTPGGATAPSDPAEPGGTAIPVISTEPGSTADPSTSGQPDNPEPPGTSAVPADPFPAGQSFGDVADGAWYADAVRYVVDKAYFNGTGADTFSPDLTMSRAMFVTVLGRMAGAAQDTGQIPAFADVPAGQWYTPYVAWASDNKIVNGYSRESFGPGDPVTREQMAAILYRYAQFSGRDLSGADESRFREFRDADQVAEYARTPMIWATGRHLINGMGDASLAPQKTATRAQVAQLVMNFDRLLAEAG